MPQARETNLFGVRTAVLGLLLTAACAAPPADPSEAIGVAQGPLFGTAETDPFRITLGVTPMFAGAAVPYDGEDIVDNHARLGLTHEDSGLVLRVTGDRLNAPGGGARTMGPVRPRADGTFHFVENQPLDMDIPEVCERGRGWHDARVSVVIKLYDAGGRRQRELDEDVVRVELDMDAMLEDVPVNALGCFSLAPTVDIRLQSGATTIPVNAEGPEPEPAPEPEPEPEPAPAPEPEPEPEPAPASEPEPAPAPEEEPPSGSEPTPSSSGTGPTGYALGEDGESCAVVAPETWRCVESPSLASTASQVCRDGLWQTYQLEPTDCRACAGRYSEACDGTERESGPGHLPLGESGVSCEDAPNEMWRCAWSPSWSTTVSQVCRGGAWLTFHVEPRDCMSCWGSFADACRQAGL